MLHTFSVPMFARLAHRGGPHAGFWHLLAEVEAVFGVWAFALIVAMAALSGPSAAIGYMDTRNFTEPLFVFTIMAVSYTHLDVYKRQVPQRSKAALLSRATPKITCTDNRLYSYIYTYV